MTRPRRSTAILGSSPDIVLALNNLAGILSFQPGKEKEALALIDHAVELAGAVPGLLDTRAVIRLNNGRADLALGDLRTAIAVSPQLADLHFHLRRATTPRRRTGRPARPFARPSNSG